ncbi:MAG: NAD(P)(+) transhydrogenase (Re/Si-specific) subunit alpha, partial [Actinobacteria bacterium]|nr:NAD(P)(+) transhydrogenase (Re/Si-specific) subunit alpha [Actinomycetota bacterium]
DVLITTAAVPGRTAPRLVTAQMAAQMKPGSVIVDLAAESGGNVEGSIAGEVITTANGVTMWGGKDVPSQLPYHASMLFSRNVVNLLMLMSKTVDGKPTGGLVPDFTDEIIDSAALTDSGARREKGK